MLLVSTKKSFENLRLIRLATELCHPVPGPLVRVYFRLSDLPPLGWSYMFTNVWQDLKHPLKRKAGIQGDAIWIDCQTEEVGSCLYEELMRAVEQPNVRFLQGIQEQAAGLERQVRLDAQLESQLDALSRTLFPPESPPETASPRSRGFGWHAKLGRLFRRTSRQNI